MIATKRDPALWRASKRRACARAGLCAHSARKMQWAARDYRARGGAYVGARDDARNSLARWSAERWRTRSGAPSRGVRRYLPDAAWRALTPEQARRTDRAKRRGAARGAQWVRQPADVAAAVARARRGSRRGSRRSKK
jgi:hypothetical protein